MKKAILFLLLLSALSSNAQKTSSNTFSSMTSVNPKPELFDELNFGGFDLVSANFKYSKDNTLQKVVISPFKLLQEANYFSDIKFNLAQKDKISTFGVAFGFDNTNPYNKFSGRVDRKFSKMAPQPTLREQNTGESNADFAKYLEDYNNKADQARVNYFKSLARGAFSFNLGYNYSAFDILGGTEVKGGDGLISNNYVDKAHSFTGDFNYAYSEKLMFNIGGSIIRKRNTAVEGQKMVNYKGMNFSGSYRFIYLQQKENLLKNQDYVKSFFIPSILFGMSYEYIKAKGEEIFFEDGYKYQRIITPFLDFKISPSNQFRIGIPFKKYESANANQIGLGPFLQYTLTLANKG